MYDQGVNWEVQTEAEILEDKSQQRAASMKMSFICLKNDFLCVFLAFIHSLTSLNTYRVLGCVPGVFTCFIF